jgi:drug/metabolite transporter (DMT)-like permease
MKKIRENKIFNIALLFVVAIIWGFAFVAQVDGVKYVGPLTLNGVRFVLGVLSLTPVVLIFERERGSKAEQKKTALASLLAGTVLFLATTVQQIGIEKTGSAGISGFITGLYMILVPIACFIFFKKRTGLNVWIGAVLGVVGLSLLCLDPQDGFSFGLGEILLIIGSLLWTAHVIIIDKFSKELRPLHFSWGQFAVCAFLSVITMFIFEKPTLAGIWDARVAILYCGILSVGVAYTLQVIAQKNADPTFAAIVLSTESVFSAVGGVIFGTDNIPWFGYVGCAVMFAGIIVSQIEMKRKNKKRLK